MGIYNNFGKNFIQLKVGDLCMMHYKVGDKVDIDDGLYLAYEGVVAIKKGKLLATFSEKEIFDKWGNSVQVQQLLYPNNPIIQVIERGRIND